MSDLIESPSKVELKTPKTKGVELIAEATIAGDEDDEKDTSIMIPIKSSPVVHLPPVELNENPQIIVQKKRKFQLVADPDDLIEPSHLIPSKSRNSSISIKSQRVPSLNDISKPELSPPSLNLSYQSFEETPSDVLRSGSPDRSLRSFSSPIQLERSSVTTSTPGDDSKKTLIELRREESKIDNKLRQMKKTIETLKRAKVILAKKDSQDNEELIEKWRDAAQRASNYLLNAAIEKINKSGGKREYERREKEKLRNSLEFSLDSSFQERIAEITNSEEFEAQTEEEKERILQDLEEEADKSMRQLEKDIDANDNNNDDDNDDADDFTMMDLYKKLKLDYKLVYPGE